MRRSVLLLSTLIDRFIRNVRGNAAIVVGLSLPIILAMVGGAIDFGRATQLRMELQDAADVASVSAVSVNSPGYKAASSQVGDGNISQGATQALAVFTSNLRSYPELASVAPNAVVTKTGTSVTSTVTVAAIYRPYILGLVGMSSMSLNIKSTSTASLPPYIDFFLLLDNSPSMGVGATMADIDKMVANTSDKCAFACHQLDKPGTDYYAKAKILGVTTRIDVVRQATQKLMATAKSTETIVSQYRMAIYDFGLSADTIDQKSPAPYKISGLSSDLTAAAANATAVDLMVMPYQGYNSDRQSNFQSMTTGMNAIIPEPGDGTSPQKPQQVLFLVSDGTNDSYDCAYSNGNTCRRITPLDTSQCTKMKARGVRIAVLYTTYLPLPTNAFYNQYMAKYITPTSQIASQMQACASPGLYFEVGPSQGISDAMTALFKKVIAGVRISS